MSNLRARVKSPEGRGDGGTANNPIKAKCPTLYANGKKHIPASASSSALEQYFPLRLRQTLLYVIVVVQFIVITKQNAKLASFTSETGKVGGRGTTSYDQNVHTKSQLRNANANADPGPQQQLTFNQNPIYSDGHSSSTGSYSDPIVHPIQETSLISRVWHSNGSPHINPDLQSGSCWCSGDDYCMCTPSLAIDTILTSGDEHVWLVKRKDAGKYATMGGFVEVGETTAEACARELKEEMNLDLYMFGRRQKNEKDDEGEGENEGADDKEKSVVPVLEGIYADPMRDARRHTVSAVYSINIPEGVIPKAGDDAAEVLRIHYDEIENLDFFADHKTILRDYIAKKKKAGKDAKDPIKRDLCSQ